MSARASVCMTRVRERLLVCADDEVAGADLGGPLQDVMGRIVSTADELAKFGPRRDDRVQPVADLVTQPADLSLSGITGRDMHHVQLCAKRARKTARRSDGRARCRREVDRTNRMFLSSRSD